jgi:hypothetical protein
MAGFLADLGLQVLRNGYNVIPIKPGAKYPVIRGWQKLLTTAADVGYWLGNGHADAGVGITCGKVSFVDCDIPAVDDAKWMEDWIITEIGFAPVRIGNFPKRGFMFRAHTPIRKMASRVYRDELGRRFQIEILGEGQQFVAYHVHPETGKPYQWQIGDGPEWTPVDELPVITVEDCRRIIAEFERLMAVRGYTAEGAVASTVREYGEDELEELGVGSDPSGMSEEELGRLVRSIPNDDRVPYGDETNTDAQLGWFKVMCAIHHETGGGEIGRRLALEWSARAAKHKDERFEKTWMSLGQGKGRKLTHKYIRKWAAFYGRQGLAGILTKLDAAVDVDGLKAAIADAKKLVLDSLDLERLSTSMQRNAKRLGVTLSAARARSMVRPTVEGVPEWLKGWVYLKHTADFYHKGTGERIGREAFDAAHGRYLSEGTASRYALDIAKIPVFHMTMYLPGSEATFKDASGLEWVNTYRSLHPDIPLMLSEKEKKDLATIQSHFGHLIGDKRDVELLISTLAYIVQTGKRCNYMTIIQGAEGIGKTFIAKMMGAVLGGAPNVHKLDINTIMSVHTDWAEGHQLSFIEELWLPGHRYDVLDKMKVYITDEAISVHPKFVKQYTAVNTTTYLGFTNHRDAIPLGIGDTRYYVILSPWQSKEEVDKFKKENPFYYRNLFRAISESPGAIYGWLKDYKLSPEFSPVGRAPSSTGKTRLIDEQRPDLQIAIEDLMEQNIPGISEEITIIHLLVEELNKVGFYSDHRSIISTLRRLQLTPVLGRRVKMTNPRRDYYCWSKSPEIISADVQRLRALIIDRVLGGEL